MYRRRPKSILVALAPGPGGLEAAIVHQTLVIGAYAKSIGAELVLYHCVPTLRTPLETPTWQKLMNDTITEIEQTTKVLQRIQSQVASAELPVRVVVEPANMGPLAATICKAVKEQKCDMLNDILLQAEYPVAVLTPNTSAFAFAPETFRYFLDQGPRALVVPVDISFDDASCRFNEALVKRSIDIASPMRADIDLFCAAHLPKLQFKDLSSSNIETYFEGAQAFREGGLVTGSSSPHVRTAISLDGRLALWHMILPTTQ